MLISTDVRSLSARVDALSVSHSRLRSLVPYVNYIEHYGLVRENKGAVLPHHSWNSSTSFGNAVMFNLQRHSDHHASSGKPYFLLESIDDAPQLPAGYPAMMLLALLPGAWKAVMDGRIGATTGEDLTKQKGE